MIKLPGLNFYNRSGVLNKRKYRITLNVVKILPFVTLIFFTSCNRVYTTYYTNNIAENQKIAVLPFEISFVFQKIPGGETIKYMRELEKEEGLILQKKLYNHLLKNNFSPYLKIQDIDETNSMLKQHEVTMDNIWKYEKTELAKICGVSAVISSTANYPINSSKLKTFLDPFVKFSSFSAPLLIDLFVITSPVPYVSMIAIPAIAIMNLALNNNKSFVNVSIHDSNNSDIIWRCKVSERPGFSYSYKKFGERATKRISRHFPFKEKNKRRTN